MDTHLFDAVVIGAGIAGATAAAHLATDRRVALVEAEDTPGYHTTGRSAAIWVLNYGPPDVRTLTGLSRSFFEEPPPGFADTPILTRRAVLFLAPPDQVGHLDRLLATGTGVREVAVTDAAALLTPLRPGYAARAALEDDAFDMDVAALHAGFLRQVRTRGGVLTVRSRTSAIERRGGVWRVRVAGGDTFAAPVLVNAAGAWGDEVAAQAGTAPIGLQPKRRTGVLVDSGHPGSGAWPMVMDAASTWYARPDGPARLMVSPADETPMAPHDVAPDELDVAVAVDRMQAALDVPVHRVVRSWAGLRTFTPDGSLAIGWDAAQAGFLWCVGQGGYGIQTSPAAGRLAADLVAGRDPGPAAAVLDAVRPGRFALQAA